MTDVENAVAQVVKLSSDAVWAATEVAPSKVFEAPKVAVVSALPTPGAVLSAPAPAASDACESVRKHERAHELVRGWANAVVEDCFRLFRLGTAPDSGVVYFSTRIISAARMSVEMQFNGEPATCDVERFAEPVAKDTAVLTMDARLSDVLEDAHVFTVHLKARDTLRELQKALGELGFAVKLARLEYLLPWQKPDDEGTMKWIGLRIDTPFNASKRATETAPAEEPVGKRLMGSPTPSGGPPGV